MTRALLLSPSSAPGGAERVFASLARRLPALGVEPQIVLLQSGPLEHWLEDAGCHVEVIKAGRARQLHRTADTLARLARRASAVDVVISNQSKGHLYGGLAALAARRPAIWWQQGMPERSPIDLLAARIPAALVIASSPEAVRAQRRLTPHRRTELVHLGIDVAAVQARAGSGVIHRDAQGWRGKRLVGIVGRLQEWKGQDVFLRAAARVAPAHRDVIFVVVGGAILGWEGDYPDKLRQLAAELGIKDQVYFAGHQDDVYPWFDALDVVVHASYGEPFGLVLVEAMALAKPLVATAAGGPLEIVEDDVSGLLVPPGDDTAMASAISRLLGDEAFRDALGAAAADRAERFDEVRMAERFAALLSSLSLSHRPSIDDPVLAPDLEAHQPARMAGEGTHELVMGMLNMVDRGLVLDAGAGEGALVADMCRRGWPVQATGIREDQYFAELAPYVVSDLGLGLPYRGSTFRAVVAIEVIEHLEAPFLFFREAARCLVDGGVLIVTTPNVLSIASKISFAVRDVPIYFGETEFTTNGHISPVSRVYIERIAQRIGLEVEDVLYSVGKLPVPKLRHMVPLRSERFRNKHLGESLIVKLRKTGQPVGSVVRG